MTKEIELTQGQVTIVDNDVYEKLSKHRWFAQKHGNTFYACRGVNLENGKWTNIQMQREILGLVPGDRKISDHKNRITLDNRLANLRVVSKAVNAHNHGGHSHNTSGFNGVHWHVVKNKWHAYIKVDCKQIHLGYYDELSDAVEARRQGELKYWGDVR